jgi:hypothetical protein
MRTTRPDQGSAGGKGVDVHGAIGAIGTPGKRTLTEMLPVQHKLRADTVEPAAVSETAAQGGSGDPLPHLDVVQAASGRHDVTGQAGNAHEQHVDRVANPAVAAGSAESALGGTGALIGAALLPAQAPGVSADRPLFSGHLEDMRRQREFHEGEKGLTLDKACIEAFKKKHTNKKHSEQELVGAARKFRRGACNIVTLFFIANAKELRSRQNLEKDYPSYKMLVKDLMVKYFVYVLDKNIVKESGWVNETDGRGVLTSNRSNLIFIDDSPLTKANKLLNFNGKLIRIRVQMKPIDHWLVGEIRDNKLHTSDNMVSEARTGTFDLEEYVKNGEKTKEGKETFEYLKHGFIDARVEK